MFQFEFKYLPEKLSFAFVCLIFFVSNFKKEKRKKNCYACTLFSKYFITSSENCDALDIDGNLYREEIK